MDILTQGLLGAAVATSGSRPSETKQAAWIGFSAGLLADADVLIRSNDDPLLFLEFHRHFTHSLAFIPVGALIAATLVWLLLQLKSSSPLSFSRIYFYSFLGYMLSGVLDAFTSYGTMLFWPFSDERIAWSLISIVDPIFSGILLLTLIIALISKTVTATRAGLCLCAAYLIFSYTQSVMVKEQLNQLAQSRGHGIEKSIVKPTLGNVVLWRSVYLYNGTYYIDAFRPLYKAAVFEGESVNAVNLETYFPDIDKDSATYKDIERFKHFSNDYISASPEQPDVIGDIRYSIFPLSARPLWGIKYDSNNQNAHVEYVSFRENSKEQRKRFIGLVMGKE